MWTNGLRWRSEESQSAEEKRRAVQRFQASDGEDEFLRNHSTTKMAARRMIPTTTPNPKSQTTKWKLRRRTVRASFQLERGPVSGGFVPRFLVVGAKKSLGRVRSTKFTSSVKFYRLYSHWKRSLGALDYAKCEVYGCGVVTATLPEIIKHHRTCLKVGHKLLPGVAKHSHDLMKCHNCKYRSHELRRMIRHYQNVHKMIFEEAEEKANEKKLLRSSWQLTQKAYDDLKLFD
ncbi:hypothetical protein RvY_16213-1 [Ramazzottius varieornatus]|uniref:Uncharacterized protein n=1 Tax=Ramazzottius varieornatus TaxID=947166 RepID=A0A1D1VXM0_RAMVA|nr:hypothetical protein RvY_16213-1 [Ramazzottius varieornatus]